MAIYLWEEYDSEIIKKEMKIISKLGANALRIFIRWEDLNPDFGKINEELFQKFENFLKHAENSNIKVIPTLLIGHMSGQDWFPSWFLLDSEEKRIDNSQFQIIDKPPYKEAKCKCRDIYTDPTALRNSRMQIKAILNRYKNNKAIISWDLSNENQYWMKPKTPEIGTAYMKNMYNMMKEIDPNHPITYGMGKLDEDSGFISFGFKGFAQYNDYFSVHVYPEFLYPMTGLITDFYICYRPSFECCLAKICKRPVQLQEFGLSDMFFPAMKEEKRNNLIYGYYNIVLWDVVLNEVRGGVLTWDFCDFLPQLEKRNPYDHKKFELFFGAVDSNYKMKSSGKAFKRFTRFLNEIDITGFFKPKNKIAVVLPDNFNDFPEVNDKKSMEEDNADNHSKSLFSAFLYTKMSHNDLDFISLYEYDDPLDPYQILLLPNFYHLSKKSEKKCIRFLNKKSDRVVYCSSNTYIPSALYGPLHWDIKPIKTSNLSLTPVNERLKSSFPPLIKMRSYKTLLSPNFMDESVSTCMVDTSKSKSPMMFSKPYKNNNLALFLANAPEIIHTKIRNSYQKYDLFKLYKGMFNISNIESLIDCENPLIECGVLFNQSKNEALLIVLNHEFSNQKCVLKINFSFDSIREYYDLKYKIKENNINLSMKPYQSFVFLLDR